MLPRLQAADSLRAVTVTGLGSGAIEKRTATNLLRQWKAALGPATKARRASSTELSALPIKVKRIPASP